MSATVDTKTNIAEWIGRASATTLLAGILVTGYFGVWVWGTNYQQIREERDEWKVIAIQGLRAIEEEKHVVFSSNTDQSQLTPAQVGMMIKAVKEVEVDH